MRHEFRIHGHALADVVSALREKLAAGGKRVELGRVMLTPKAAGLDTYVLLESLARHEAGDWGICCEEDAEVNERNLASGRGQRQSAFALDPAKPSKGWGENTIWVISIPGETTVLLPEEY